ncbi:MAG TPA: O-antigen ligase family protein [Candidatus Woesebacteria bacterium]|nr:O-antigen ligase family protein [Candidatus Woesebacteria bacterium]
MRLSLPEFAVYTCLFLVFIFEALGLPFGRQYARIFIGIFPLLLFSIDLVKKRQIKIPLYITTLFILFSIMTAFSTITAINIQTAFENQLMYWGVFLTFIYVFNHQKIKNRLPLFIFLMTLLLSIYAIYINFFLPTNLSWLIPRGGFQFPYMYNSANSHFAFGSFILIPLVFIYRYFLEKPTWKRGLLLFLFLMLLIMSFLRAAYVAFLIVSFLSFYTSNVIKNRKFFLVFICIIFLIFISSFILITNFQNETISNLPFKNIFVNHFELLKYKTFLNGRNEFMNQALEAIKARPLTGFGSFNYYYASLLYAQNIPYTTGTSHNLFLDIFVENGMLGGITFLILILFLIKQLWPVITKKELLDTSIFLVILSLLILFQLSHYHKFYFLFLWVFVLSALLYKEKSVLKDSCNITIISAVFLFFLTTIIGISLLLTNYKKYKEALQIYPISVPAYQSYILSLHDQNKFHEAKIYIEKLSYLYPKEPNIQDFIGNIYTLNADHKDALKHYQVALKFSPAEVAYLTFIYDEIQAIKGSEPAKKFIERYISEHRSYFEIYTSENRWFYDWCIEREIDIYKYMLPTK